MSERPSWRKRTKLSGNVWMRASVPELDDFLGQVPEELEISRALATQASLAIQLTRLANSARQSAVLEERYQLAGEIHDSLAQFFTGISMQLGAARALNFSG
jgi:signal transduction histidine kinase